MLALEAMSETQDIQLYINSQGVTTRLLLFVNSGCAKKNPYPWLSRCCNAGGSPYATIAILDMMDAIKCDISTVAFGMCASTATLLLVSVTASGHKAYCHKRDHLCMWHACLPAGGCFTMQRFLYCCLPDILQKTETSVMPVGCRNQGQKICYA